MVQCVAVVGTGQWGRNHVRTWSELKEENLIERLIVCDLDEDRARNLAAEFGCEWHTNALTLKEKFDISAASIATPTPTHVSLAIGLMEQGVDVLVEKPLAMSEKDAKIIVKHAKKLGRLLCVGHLFRYHPVIRKAAEMISGGEIGPVLHVESECLSVREPRTDIGVIAAIAIHDMDTCRDLMGDIYPSEINAYSLSSEIEGIEDYAVIDMRFPSNTRDNPVGPSAQITVSWRSHEHGKVRELRVIGRDATLHIDYSDHTGLWVHKHEENTGSLEPCDFRSTPRERVEIVDSEPSLKAELRAFANACKLHARGEPSDNLNILATGETGVIGMRLVESALQAAKG